ncbi:hypothetical protein D3C78_427830 [compost metagenome]
MLADQRPEGGGNQLRAAAAEGAIGNHQADDGVHGPGVQGPVEQRGGHGHLHRFAGLPAGRPRRWRHIVRQRFGNAEEHQADAHAGAEHHRHPRHRAEFWLFAITAQRDPAVTAGRQPQHEHHEQRGGEHEEPAEVENDPGLRAGGAAGEAGLVEEAPEDESDCQEAGETKDDPVELALETPVLACFRGFRGVRHAKVERFGDVFLCHE